MPISIHAPAKGATQIPFAYAVRCCLFQSTLPRRSDCSPNHQPMPVADFNPRSREGSDPPGQEYNVVRHLISIHAPAKGATASAAVAIFEVGFQSTLPRRERHKLRSIAGQGQIFQSTLPRRATIVLPCFPVCQDNFNPRSREGSDCW